MSDPFAAYGGTSAAATPPQTPSAAPDPFAAYGGTSAAAPQQGGADPFATYGGTTAQKPEQPQSLGGRVWEAQKEYNPTVGLISGALKEAQKHVAGAIDLADKYVVQRTTGAPNATAAVHHAANETADWLRKNTNEDTTMEKVGGFGESAAELLAPELWGSKLLEGASYADRLLEMGKNAKILEKAPGLVPVLKAGMAALKTGVGAAKSGAIVGGQTYVESGGDAEAAKTAATNAAVFHGVLDTAANVGGGLLNKFTDFVKGALPGSRTVGATEFPTTPGSNDLLLPNLKDVATDPASGQVKELLGDISKEGVYNSATRTNALRPPDSPAPQIIHNQQAFKITAARKQLSLYNKVLKDPDLSDRIGVQAAQRITNDATDLKDQIGRYADWSASQPRHPLLDGLNAARNTDSLEDAADQLTAHHGAVLDRMGDEGKYEYQRLLDQKQDLQDELNNPSKRPWSEVNEDVKTNQQSIMDLLQKNRRKAAPGEAEAAIEGQEDGDFFQNMHNFMRRRFNGVTAEEQAAMQAKPGAAKGDLQEVFKPAGSFEKQFDDFLDEDNGNGTTNREIAQRTIGDDNIANVKQMGKMFNDSTRRAQTQGLIKNIFQSIRNHYTGLRGYALAGVPLEVGLGIAHQWGKMADVAGIPAMTGAIKGTRNYIADRLAVDPEFLKSFVYAIDNKLPPRTAGPILASRMLGRSVGQAAVQKDQQQQQPTYEDKQVVAPDAARGVQGVTLPVLTQPEKTGATQ